MFEALLSRINFPLEWSPQLFTHVCADICAVLHELEHFLASVCIAFLVVFVYVPIKLFSIVIFGCIANEGYVNRPDEIEEFCIFNRNQNACNYAVGMGTLAFLSCAAFLALDVYFPQISSVKDRKKAVLADIGVSAFWSFVWFVGFCFLANQWQVAKQEDNPLREGADAARAAITFAFFSIFTWGALTLLSLERIKRVSFEEEYNKLFIPQPTPPLA